MIVTEAADRYRFITQPDHAALSGQLAARWSEAFSRPGPWHAICIAAEHHDQGWQAYDMAPRVEDGAVVDFISVPAEPWADFYGDGVTAVAAIDRYAGLLTSMHAAGLRRSAYGTRPGIPDRSSDSRFVDFVAEQEAFQRQVAAELSESERYGEYVDEVEKEFLDSLHETGDTEKAMAAIEERSRLREQYLLLQTFDTLSLYLCRSVSLDATTIGPVPTADGEGVDLNLEVAPIGPGAVRIEPYPFESAPLSVSVGARVVPVSESEDELTEAYYETERRPIEFTLHR